GCTLHALLAGHPPFRKSTPLETAMAHVEETAPPVANVRNDVPPALAAVVARMMAKDLAQRYQSPAEVASALLPFTETGIAQANQRAAALLERLLTARTSQAPAIVHDMDGQRSRVDPLLRAEAQVNRDARQQLH